MKIKRDYGKKPLRVFASYYRPHWRLFWVDILLTLFSTATSVFFPYASRYAMNELLPGKLYEAFFALMWILLGAYLLRSAALFLVARLGHRLGVLIEADMREDIFTRVQTLSFSFFDRNRTGELMSHMTTDLFDVTELAHHGPEILLEAAATLVGSLLILVTIRWELALLLALLVPLFLLFSFLMRKAVSNASRRVKEETAEINTAVEAGVSGVRTVKAFANEGEAMKSFKASNERFKKAKERYYTVFGILLSGTEFGMAAMQLAVITVGGFFIMRGGMDYIDLVTFSLYVSVFTAPIRKLTQFIELFQQGFAGFLRFLGIMRTEPDVKDAPDAEELRDVKGEVEFKNVGFRYETGGDILKNVNLTVPAGETLALVGPSGSGKTTLSQLLPRFYDVTEGAVTIDGHDVRAITQASLHRNVGIIQQDVFIFAATVRENIRYGRPGASDAEVVAAAKRAAIHDEIMAMPDGYDTWVGERGAMLSGGQKQRLSIARVFLKNPPILVLDEATSALDSVTEAAIQSSLEELSSGRTVIVVAHRLSTVRHAHRIAVVENAGVAEYGTHGELLARNGLYAGLWGAQRLS